MRKSDDYKEKKLMTFPISQAAHDRIDTGVNKTILLISLLNDYKNNPKKYSKTDVNAYIDNPRVHLSVILPGELRKFLHQCKQKGIIISRLVNALILTTDTEAIHQQEKEAKVLSNNQNNPETKTLTEENEKNLNLDDILAEWFSPVDELDELLAKFLAKK